MQFLGRFRILTKILAVVLLLAALMGSLAYLATSALNDQNQRAVRMAAAAKRSMLAARANVNVMSMIGAEFRSALDPRDDNRKAAGHVIDEQVRLFRERLDEVAKTSDQQVQALLPSVRETFAAYQQSVATTLAAVDAASSTKTSETAQKLLEVVMRSDAVAESLRSRMNAVAERMTRRAEEFEQATADEYVSTSRTLIVISVISVIAGLALGMLIGQFGISKPIQSIVALLQALAAGDYDVAVHSTERKDEVGEVAKAALVFKENGLAKTRMELERKETERRATAQRRADMLQLADRFEGAIGEIVDTVSSASTELEASATTLTSTAERGQTLATTVASASEEASTNVQSVASATEELSSSVNEISRQVQESARMASEAVEQARMTNDRVGELSKAAGRIGDVVELINTIAGQTNLLALNATIEAARAGEAGPRFRGGRLGGEGPCRANRKGHRRDRPADREHPDGDERVGERDPGYLRHDRTAVGNLLDHCGCRGGAGRGNPGNLPQRAAGRPRHPAGLRQHYRCAARRKRNRVGLFAGPLGGSVAVVR